MCHSQFFEIYYDKCAEIDQHNCHIQYTLHIDRKLQTKNWDKRLATYIFGMYDVYAWLMYHGCNTYLLHPDHQLNQQ